MYKKVLSFFGLRSFKKILLLLLLLLLLLFIIIYYYYYCYYYYYYYYYYYIFGITKMTQVVNSVIIVLKVWHIC